MSKVNKFWDWFSEHQNDFGTNFENESLLVELDTWIQSLGNYSWEVGPGTKKENQLVISPNGDIDLLEVTKKIIESAPDYSTWELYYAKQPKDWDYIFYYQIENKKLKIDASQWRYVLLKFDDGTFDIILKAPSIIKLKEEDQGAIAEILIDGILGEEKRMLFIESIEILGDFDLEHNSKDNDIKNLKDHFNQVV